MQDESSSYLPLAGDGRRINWRVGLPSCGLQTRLSLVMLGDYADRSMRRGRKTVEEERRGKMWRCKAR